MLRESLGKDVRTYLPLRELFSITLQEHVESGLYVENSGFFVGRKITKPYNELLVKRQDNLSYLPFFSLTTNKITEYGKLPFYYERFVVSSFSWAYSEFPLFDSKSGHTVPV
jgi:hypothetical protein